jgi:hypothetical protein
MNQCVDCKYYELLKSGFLTFPTCLCKEVNPVGECAVYCSKARGSEHLCGFNGRFFVPKDGLHESEGFNRLPG